jgi:anti-sigma factor RsiW
MSDPSNLDDKEREELVAFLDGELNDDDAHKVEAKVNIDPKTRAEVEALRRAWDLLDYLPRPEPSPNFTNRTLSRVGAIRQTQAVGRRRLRAALVGVAWAAALLLALGAGYGGMTLFVRRGPTEQDLVRDLRLIENERLYEMGEDLDFIHELDHPDLFGEPSGE